MGTDVPVLPLDELGVRVAGLDPQHGEDGAVEPLGRGQVRDGDADVVEHHAEATVAGMLELATPHGPARAHLHPAGDAHGALVLGHGAGGGVGAPYLVPATEIANDPGIAVAVVKQPSTSDPSHVASGMPAGPPPGRDRGV